MNAPEDDDPGRVPPHDLAAEQCTLGGMLLSKDAQAEVAEMIRPGDHYRPAHQIVHEAILALQGRGQPADAITVADYLQQAGQIAKVGGAPYLHTLIAAVPTAANAAYYARIVRKHADLRGLIRAGETIGQFGYAPDIDLDEMPKRIEAAYRVLDDAVGTAPTRPRSIADLIGPALDRIEQGPDAARGVTTGWRDLDELILGFRAGEMVTIGARPAIGKSIVMSNIAVHAALALGIPVLFASLEMSEQECTERIVAAESSVSLHSIRGGAALDDAAWDRIAAVHEKLTGCPHLIINTDPYLSVQGIRSELRSMRRAGMPAGLVVVDYLQLMTSGGKAESRQTEVSEISRGIKLLAKEYDVPVIVGSQLNRGPEMRSDHQPMLADLRESGSVEQDSSVVILLYRPDVYEQESVRAGEIDLIVRKNRQGPQATITMAFQGHYARCVDMCKPWTPTAALGSAA